MPVTIYDEAEWIEMHTHEGGLCIGPVLPTEHGLDGFARAWLLPDGAVLRFVAGGLPRQRFEPPQDRRASLQARIRYHTLLAALARREFEKAQRLVDHDPFAAIGWDGRTFGARPEGDTDGLLSKLAAIHKGATGCVRTLTAELHALPEVKVEIERRELNERLDAEGRARLADEADRRRRAFAAIRLDDGPQDAGASPSNGAQASERDAEELRAARARLAELESVKAADEQLAELKARLAELETAAEKSTTQHDDSPHSDAAGRETGVKA